MKFIVTGIISATVTVVVNYVFTNLINPKGETDLSVSDTFIIKPPELIKSFALFGIAASVFLLGLMIYQMFERNTFPDQIGFIVIPLIMMALSIYSGLVGMYNKTFINPTKIVVKTLFMKDKEILLSEIVEASEKIKSKKSNYPIKILTLYGEKGKLYSVSSTLFRYEEFRKYLIRHGIKINEI